MEKTTEKTPSPCLDRLQLTRALSMGLDASQSRHLDRCEHCQSEWWALERTRVLLKELPEASLTEDRRWQMREAIVTAATATMHRGYGHAPRIWMLVPLAAAAGLVFGAGLLRRPGVDSSVPAGVVWRAQVKPQGSAVFTHSSSQPDEIVRVSEGTLNLQVRHLNPGERFRLVTSDAEVEVRGTAFEIHAHEDRLLSVRVSQGLVEVRPVGKPTLLVGAGGEWNALGVASTQSMAPVATSAPLSVRKPARVVTPHSRLASISMREGSTATPHKEDERVAAQPGEKPAPPPLPPEALVPEPPSEVERQFQLGWSALRAHAPQKAARAFADAARRAGNQPIAEDAHFWHAVALERAAHDKDAQAALVAFIAQYPRSPRIGEASALLGWLLLETGDLAGSAARFRVAAADSVEKVRDSGRAGLDAVAAKRAGF